MHTNSTFLHVKLVVLWLLKKCDEKHWQHEKQEG